MIYLDSNIFVIAAIDKTELGKRARDFLIDIHKGEINAFTSTLTFDEFFWKITEELGKEEAIIISENLLKISNLIFIDVTQEIMWNSLEIIKKYNLDPRDAIHLASASYKKIKVILSEDKDFDKIKEIKRKSL